MKRICAWCRRDMGIVENSPHPDTEISHGICEQCVENLSFQNGVHCKSYIDSFPLPILLLDVHADTYLVTKYVNTKACALLGKDPQAVVQHLAGNVFECSHARLPEGCGRTIHCSGCTIRRSVMETFKTGKPLSLVPAILKRTLNGDADAVDLYITTVKVAGLVMLRIDRTSDPHQPQTSIP